MKTMKSIITIGIIACFAGFWLNSCDTSNADVLPDAKQMDEYVLQRAFFVNSEITKVNACVVGSDKNNFRANQAANFDAYQQQYLDDLSAAGALLSNPAQLTYQNIVQIDSALAVSGKNFNSNILLYDHRALNDAIVKAEELLAGTPAGILPGEAPQAAITVFNAAITAAKTSRNTVNVPDLATQVACDKLAAAKRTFIDAIN
jgi:hypothetical protein